MLFGFPPHRLLFIPTFSIGVLVSLLERSNIHFLSVLVDPEDAHLMKHGQLGDRDGDQGHEIDHKMEGVILCVETGEEEPEGYGTRGKQCKQLIQMPVL